MLSLISGPRAVVLALTTLVASAGLFAAGYWLLSTIALGAILRLAHRYYEIGRGDALQIIEVKESANLDNQTPRNGGPAGKLG